MDVDRRSGAVGRTAATTLVLGGARSGKSELAEGLAERAADTASGRQAVTYVATALPSGNDDDFAERIARHQARRPAGWRTVEVARGEDLGALLTGLLGPEPVVLVDSLGTWLAGCPDFAPPAAPLVEALEHRAGHGLTTILVSDEVGLGVHPETAAGRRFRDALGALNRRVADAATEVVLVVAGRPLRLGGGRA